MVEYERILHAAGLIDFDDMVFLGLRLVERHEWVRKALRPAIRSWSSMSPRTSASPCIGWYSPSASQTGRHAGSSPSGTPTSRSTGFTGARPELLKGLAEDERVESVRLRLNYRSRSSIVAASEVVLGEERGYVSASGEGGLIDFHERPGGLRDQAATVCRKLISEAIGRGAARNLGQMAVLYQDNTMGT